MTAFGWRPSTLAVDLVYSKTRACSYTSFRSFLGPRRSSPLEHGTGPWAPIHTCLYSHVSSHLVQIFSLFLHLYSHLSSRLRALLRVCGGGVVWGFGVLFLSCVCVCVSGMLFYVCVCVTCWSFYSAFRYFLGPRRTSPLSTAHCFRRLFTLVLFTLVFTPSSDLFSVCTPVFTLVFTPRSDLFSGHAGARLSSTARGPGHRFLPARVCRWSHRAQMRRPRHTQRHHRLEYCRCFIC